MSLLHNIMMTVFIITLMIDKIGDRRAQLKAALMNISM